MHLDFWNNPLVVSAFRVKYRRSGPFALTCTYVLALVITGSLLEHYQDRLAYPWLRLYLVTLISTQFLVASALAVTSTSTSMVQEVTNRTLDFQRIASLSPGQILLGKLLGEPAIAFLLTMASIPLAVICWMFGAASFPVILLLYVNIVTTTLLVGSLGLMNRLESPETAAQSGVGCGMGVMVVIFIVQLVMQLRFMLSNPWSEACVGLFTPIPIIYGLLHDTPWERGVSLFGWQVPYLLATPVAQLATALVFFHIMTRRLVNPLNTSLSKPFAYAMLAVVDLLIAAVLYDAAPVVVSPVRLAAIFCLAHLVTCAGLVWTVTPWRETLLSWVWRFRGRLSPLADLLRGPRSENSGALIVFAATGLLVLVTGVVLPQAVQNPQPYRGTETAIASVAAVMVLLLISVGTWYQWLLLIMGRGGSFGLVAVLGMLIVVPHGVGEYYQLDLLKAFSPSAHFAGWLIENERLPLSPLVVVYGSILIVFRLLLTRRLQAHVRRVQRTIEAVQREDTERRRPSLASV